jgi:signal transduction histidine kinase
MSSFEQAIFQGEGEMRRLFRETEWSSTTIGAVDSWSEVLKLSVALCLNSRFPLILWWGPELAMLYNDSYVGHLRGKHPKSLAKPGKEVWTEIWPVIGPMLDGVFTTGEATWSDDLQLFLERNGYAEETYHTFSYSAVKDSTGKIVGIFTPVAETTERVIGERRLRIISELARTKADTEGEVLKAISVVLETNKTDLPLCALYAVDTESHRCELLANNAESDAVRRYLKTDSLIAQLLSCARSGMPITLDALTADDALLPKSPLGITAKQAIIIPVSLRKESESLLLLAVVSPHQELNQKAITFFDSVCGTIATVLKDVRAYEQERRRAEALEQLDRAKTVFFNNVSHEFRTPIALMLGPLERLLMRKFENEDHADLEIVQHNALRLLKLVNSLLDFSRIEAGRYEARFEPTDLSQFTSELTSLFRSAIESEGVALEVHCEELKEKPYVDREMWEKIVLNLLSNAFKFTRAGKISVNVRETDAHFELSVSDTGIGIAADELPNVFKRFHRFKAEGARTYEGSGIGLAMVSELVRLHGGKVSVQSDPGVGTTFQVTIPLGHDHLPADQVVHESHDKLKVKHAAAFLLETSGWRSETARAVTSPDQMASAGGQQRIVIADDNADMRDYLYRLLSPFWSIEPVSNGRQALEALEREPAALLIADIMMPELDGFELVRAIRSSDKLMHTPVLLLSARAGEEARAEGIEEGANDYLVKPFSARELCARIANLLQQRMVSQALETAVQQRTLELESALQSKSRFLATVSHEVRTPLSGVMGLIELIAKTSAEEDIRQMSTIAFASSQRLLQILNDLLDASKLQAGKILLEYRNFAIRPVIGDAVQLVKREADEKHIAVSSVVASDVPELVCGDELRVRQILFNLIFNAVKFTDNGEVKIEVILRNMTPAVTDLRFTVRDTGIGISDDQRQKLFTPFEQLQSSTSRIYGGTGLGLSICQNLIELMHGEIGVESEPGKGSTFWFHIPFRADKCQT